MIHTSTLKQNKRKKNFKLKIISFYIFDNNVTLCTNVPFAFSRYFRKALFVKR